MLVKNIKQSEIELIHEKSMYVLEHIGVIFEHPELLEFLKREGVKTEGSKVFFDRSTVERALESAPASFVIKTPYEELKIGEGGIAIATSSGSRSILKDGQLVEPSMEDYIKIRKLDATSPVVNLSSSPLPYIAELPADRADLLKAALTLKYSKRPIIASCAKKKDAEETIELVGRFYGMSEGRYVIGVGNVISPLRYDKNDVEAILSYSTRDLPVVIACCATPGLTSPITVGGTIVQNNAELLAGIVMTQLVHPGCPVVYGNVTFCSNMRYVTPVSWGPESAVIAQYACAMAHHYKLPCRIGGSLSAAKTLDWQDGAQSAMSLMTAFDCGVDFMFHACGELEGLNIFSYEKFVLDEELIAQRLSVAKRDFITEEAINLESMADVGPGGNFMMEEDTLDLYEEELYLSNLFSCETYDKWSSMGSPSAVDRARKLVEKRLAEYVQPEFTTEQDAILQEVLGTLS